MKLLLWKPRLGRRLLLLLPLVGVLFMAPSCGSKDPGDAKGGNSREAGLKEAWDLENDPDLMDDSFVAEHHYTAKFSQLPLTGRLAKIPWSDDYWPHINGGISYRWQEPSEARKDRIAYKLLSPSELLSIDLSILSPAEKYDLYRGDLSYPLTEAERERSEVMKTIRGHPHYEAGFKIPEWEGLCHAWAPATLLYDEPQAVTLTVPKGPLKGQALTFASSDVKALLSYFLNEKEAESQLLGMRCYSAYRHLKKKLREGSISYEEYYEQKRACDDVNAGAFHIVLANQIARRKQGFIIDKTRSEEVWNQPVYAYEAKVISSSAEASRGAAPGTVKELLVETQVHFIEEVEPSFAAAGRQGLASEVYRYRLELNAKGAIIGGAWPSRHSGRPDFLWKQDRPEFGDDFADLAHIYKKSLQSQPRNEWEW